MVKFRKMVEREDGWSDEIMPLMDGYKMACCDCGLVHDLQFYVAEVTAEHENGDIDGVRLDPTKYRVVFRARRNKRSTAQVRRYLNK